MPQPQTAIDPALPVRLQPVYIAKPWGQEIWYTGMEARGESRVQSGGLEMPISEYLAADPQRLCRSQPVLLLKVLDPSPAPVTGDLYFEVHEEKQEVYVVTAVDPRAWPQGKGGIRFGMNQDLRAQYADDQSFRQAYLQAVTAYEAIRRRIDNSGEAVAAEEEQQARAYMESFTELQALAVGDVVRVPTWTPHALQHGVRVVEFQTPTYERFIISFAQKVLTQDHWDSPHAVANMHLHAPAPALFEDVQPGVQRIARFDDFNVWRVDLAAAGPLTLPEHIPYAVCMALADEVTAGVLPLAAEQACFIPADALHNNPLNVAGANPAAGPHLLIAAPAL